MKIAAQKKIFNSPPVGKAAPQSERMEQIERLTQLLDEAFQIPGTNYRVGWDTIIGLVPGLGDIATTALSAYMIYQARQMGASKWVIARMMGNVGLDFIVGAIPLAGDLFDAAWKSNRRNTELLKRHFRNPKP